MHASAWLKSDNSWGVHTPGTVEWIVQRTEIGASRRYPSHRSKWKRMGGLTECHPFDRSFAQELLQFASGSSKCDFLLSP